MSKVLSVKVHYPETKEGMDELNSRYNKALAKVLIETLPPKVIDELIERLREQEQ